MNNETMINILKTAGYTESAARRGLELGTVIMNNLEDFEREFPDLEPETVKYNGVTYFIAFAN